MRTLCSILVSLALVSSAIGLAVRNGDAQVRIHAASVAAVESGPDAATVMLPTRPVFTDLEWKYIIGVAREHQAQLDRFFAQVAAQAAADREHQRIMDSVPAQLRRIAGCEGGAKFLHRDHGPRSTASGKYGFLDGTWRTWRGAAGAVYRRAMDAPEWVQDLAAMALYRAKKTTPWVASRRCWG